MSIQKARAISSWGGSNDSCSKLLQESIQARRRVSTDFTKAVDLIRINGLFQVLESTLQAVGDVPPGAELSLHWNCSVLSFKHLLPCLDVSEQEVHFGETKGSVKGSGGYLIFSGLHHSHTLP